MSGAATSGFWAHNRLGSCRRPAPDESGCRVGRPPSAPGPCVSGTRGLRCSRKIQTPRQPGGPQPPPLDRDICTSSGLASQPQVICEAACKAPGLPPPQRGLSPLVCGPPNRPHLEFHLVVSCIWSVLGLWAVAVYRRAAGRGSWGHSGSGGHWGGDDVGRLWWVPPSPGATRPEGLTRCLCDTSLSLKSRPKSQHGQDQPGPEAGSPLLRCPLPAVGHGARTGPA